MNNPNSTSGVGEDIIRAFVQFGATEMHLKTLYEKTLAEMENGIINVEIIVPHQTTIGQIPLC